ncbi:hypothetical protein FRC12_005718 [Ceratobasidium sp. 428]|nr:hypothetical protein FRC12_005718 [Ceratobasidium sp. 428]
MQCLGYSYLDDPVPRPTQQRRHIFASYSPGTIYPASSGGRSRVLTSEADATSSTQSSLGRDAPHMDEMWPPDPQGDSNHASLEQLDLITARENAINNLLWSEVFSSMRVDSQSLSTRNDLLETGFDAPAVPLESIHPDSTGAFNPSPDHNLGAPPPQTLILHNNASSLSTLGTSNNDFRYMTAGQAGFLQAPSTPEDPQDQTVSPSNLSSQTYFSSEGSIQPLPMVEYDDDSSDGSEDLDTEGVMVRVGSTLALDRNVASNSLPYVISSYFRWIIRVVFEPLKLVERMEYLLNKRYASDDLRYATTLVADIAYWLVNNPTSGEGFLALSRLQARIDHKIALVNANREPPSEVCAHEALSTLLYEIEEMICIQSFSTTLAHTIRLHKSAALVYRYTCSEPPDMPIHLPAKLLQSDSRHRSFPVMDILLSLSTCQPMLFRYDITPLSEPFELDSHSPGIQWMHGIPDQFLIMLARMNMLREDSAPNIDPNTISNLEVQVSSFESTFDRSTDSYLTIARLTVQETWRQAMYIYLYMVSPPQLVS